MTTSHEVDGPVPPGRDPDTYDRLRRRVLWSMPSGLYVVGTRAEDRRNLMTISWVTQVAMSPKLDRHRRRVRSGDPRVDRRGAGVRPEPPAPVTTRRGPSVRQARDGVVRRRRHRRRGDAGRAGARGEHRRTDPRLCRVVVGLRAAPRPGPGQPQLVRGRGRRLRRGARRRTEGPTRPSCGCRTRG